MLVEVIVRDRSVCQRPFHIICNHAIAVYWVLDVQVGRVRSASLNQYNCQKMHLRSHLDQRLLLRLRLLTSTHSINNNNNNNNVELRKTVIEVNTSSQLDLPQGMVPLAPLLAAAAAIVANPPLTHQPALPLVPAVVTKSLLSRPLCLILRAFELWPWTPPQWSCSGICLKTPALF
jgi:hypothetical protein